mgnify:CR=1 FL=1
MYNNLKYRPRFPGQIIKRLRGKSAILEDGHTLILGWSSRIFPILQQLAIANENVPNPVVVIFADVDRFTPEQKALSLRMQGLWAGFGQQDFGAEWPRVAGAGPVRVFTAQGDRLDDAFFARHNCDFWDGTPFGAVH